MENAKILILNLQKIEFKDKNGKDSAFCKITYGMKISNSDKFKGLSILEGSADVKAFDTMALSVGKECVATIDHVPTQNGIRYVISKVNNESVR